MVVLSTTVVARGGACRSTVLSAARYRVGCQSANAAVSAAEPDARVRRQPTCT